MERSNADFAPHMEGKNAHFAPHMERRHSCRDQIIAKFEMFANFNKVFQTTFLKCIWHMWPILRITIFLYCDTNILSFKMVSLVLYPSIRGKGSKKKLANGLIGPIPLY